MNPTHPKIQEGCQTDKVVKDRQGSKGIFVSEWIHTDRQTREGILRTDDGQTIAEILRVKIESHERTESRPGQVGLPDS